MILSIILCYLAGGLILLIARQMKYINIFEIFGLWFGVGLSLFIMESIFSSIFFNKISILPPFITTIFLIWYFIWWWQKEKWSLPFWEWKKQYSFLAFEIKKYGIWRRVCVFFFIIMVLFKVVLSCLSNISHPTLWEDAVSGWDLKTKVFFENKAIILDRNNPENLWWEYKRSVFAPLVDLYFLLSYKHLPEGLTNIISSLIYFNIALLLFGIFLRKFDSFIASIAAYIWISLPIIFIHSIDAYFNLVSAYFLFSFAFYISDQVIAVKEKNLLILLPLGILVFLDSSIRSESLLLVSVLLVIDFSFLFFQKAINRTNSLSFIPVIFGIILSWGTNKYLHSFSPKDNIMTDGFDIFSLQSLSNLFVHISNTKTLFSPLEQAIYHPDYNLLYLIFLISIVYIFINRLHKSELSTLLMKTFILYVIFLVILYIEPAFWLENAFWFIRYSMALIPFALFFPVYILGNLYSKKYLSRYHVA